MRLTKAKRAALLVLGLALLSSGTVGAMKDWSGVGLTTLIVAGLVSLLAAIIGAMPQGNWKEGELKWPEPDPFPRIDELETQASKLTQDLEKLTGDHRRLKDVLIDFILANEPDPDGEMTDEEMTDEERLDELRSGYQDLYNEVDHRRFTGEDYDDGISTTELAKTLDRVRYQLYREERRYAARVRFGKAKPPEHSWLDESLIYYPLGDESGSPVDVLMSSDTDGVARVPKQT